MTVVTAQAECAVLWYLRSSFDIYRPNCHDSSRFASWISSSIPSWLPSLWCCNSCLSSTSSSIWMMMMIILARHIWLGGEPITTLSFFLALVRHYLGCQQEDHICCLFINPVSIHQLSADALCPGANELHSRHKVLMNQCPNEPIIRC